ncbi:MAG: radical SAM protein [uncultured bacterium]|nr:MAG: radical SAM protein [uncultured bacterium]HBD05157.1 hypothetical protein [Candidatus Uhrbacteria bacterium]
MASPNSGTDFRLAHSIGGTMKQQHVTLVIPPYPYGKGQVFLNGSIVSIAARLKAMNRTVSVIDLNIDRLEDVRILSILRQAHLIGVSLTGSPHIPGCIELAKKLQQINPSAVLMLGGQVIENLTRDQFRSIFGQTIKQIQHVSDLAKVLGCNVNEVPSPETVSYRPVLENMEEERLTLYLRHEMPLVVSQGCVHGCHFCAASKKRKESFRSLLCFEDDLLFMAQTAKKRGLTVIKFYASSLDFFQNPGVVREYLQALARVREQTGVDIRVRCLSRLDSFIKATKADPETGKLLARAGLWNIGFGVDGTDASILKAQGKGQYTTEDAATCIRLCLFCGVKPELLMVFGFPQDNLWTLLKTVLISFAAVLRWGVVIRPYMAKDIVPGNRGWLIEEGRVKLVVSEPLKFYNLDFAALATKITHPRVLHRWLCNIAYLTLCAVLWPFGKCSTAPVLPQSGKVLGPIAKRINRLMPFDR